MWPNRESRHWDDQGPKFFMTEINAYYLHPTHPVSSPPPKTWKLYKFACVIQGIFGQDLHQILQNCMMISKFGHSFSVCLSVCVSICLSVSLALLSVSVSVLVSLLSLSPSPSLSLSHSLLSLALSLSLSLSTCLSAHSTGCRQVPPVVGKFHWLQASAACFRQVPPVVGKFHGCRQVLLVLGKFSRL